MPPTQGVLPQKRMQSSSTLTKTPSANCNRTGSQAAAAFMPRALRLDHGPESRPLTTNQRLIWDSAAERAHISQVPLHVLNAAVVLK